MKLTILQELDARLTALRAELETIADTRKSQSLREGKQSGGQVSAVEVAADRRRKTAAKIRATEKEYQERKQEMLLVIEGVPDSLMRLLLYWRCVEFKGWDEIAKQAGKDGDTLRVYFKRGVKKWNL